MAVDPAQAELRLWLLAWLLLSAVLAIHGTRRGHPGVGLVLAYLAQLWLLHWIGASVHAFSWNWGVASYITLEGLRQSTYGLIGLTLGAVALAPRVASATGLQERGPPARRPPADLPTRCVVVGVVLYFVLLPVLGHVPTVTAILSCGLNLAIVGVSLHCWTAWWRGRPIGGWVALLLVLPGLTLLLQGFLGFGVLAALAGLCFLASFYRPRWHLVLAAVALSWLALSFYVGYMRDREAIREEVWGGAPMSSRVDRVLATVTRVEPFDPTRVEDLGRIEDRLNQSRLVGLAVLYMELGSQDHARGRTLLDALLAPIPRVIWRDKPIRAGSGDLVADYTGQTFAEGTSVGVGQVLELYINFGSLGVFFGFVVLGTALGTIDRAAGARLVNGEWLLFVRWYLPGMMLLQAGGSFVELTASSAAAVVLAWGGGAILAPREAALTPALARGSDPGRTAGPGRSPSAGAR